MGWDQGMSAEDYKKRRVDRHTVDTLAQLRHRGLYSVEVKIRDISTAGFMAECHETVRIGSSVALDIPGIGPVDAQVRWQIGGSMGGKFQDPISLAACEWTAVPLDEVSDAD